MSPEYLTNISSDLVLLYSQIESRLLMNIAKKISSNKSLFLDGNINDWQLDRLRQLEGLTKENARIIAKETGRSVKEVEAIFDRAVKQGTLSTEATIGKGVQKGVLTPVPPINESVTIKSALSVATSSAKTTLNRMNNTLLGSAGEVYVKAVNKATSDVLAGVATRQQVMDETLRVMANNGLTGFVARNGAEWSPEAYTHMVIRSDVKNTITEVTNLRIQEAGGNYVEINAYSGARPLCSEDQGQIFSLNDDTTPITDINGNAIFPRAWSSSTYGQAAGILGINCGHQQFMFVPEISAYDREVIPQKENDALYQESQQQRYLERQVRQAKREKDVLVSGGASKEQINRANRLVSERQANIREFTKQTDRRRDYTREKVITA